MLSYQTYEAFITAHFLQPSSLVIDRFHPFVFRTSVRGLPDSGCDQWLCARGKFLASRTVAKLDRPPARRATSYPTQPIPGQIAGTSGVRVRTRVAVETPNFVENWVQSLFDELGSSVVGRVFILGGDGRYYNKEAIRIVLRMAAAAGVGRVVVGRGGLMSTPAVSAVIRTRGAVGGVILTASHNPGGLEGDWGVKFNGETGGPGGVELMRSVGERTKEVRTVILAEEEIGNVDLNVIGVTEFEGGFVVEVVDPVKEYLEVLKDVFDFDKLRKLVARPDFDMLFDAMNAVTGVYAKRILVTELGIREDCILNGVPLDDFGGLHPDPNLTYAAELVQRMDPKFSGEKVPQFGAASDGDGDRNMILGRGFFVCPADSLAIICENACEAIPYFARTGLKGVARSMPTAPALDRVARRLGITCYETPTGWKHFGTLMDAGRLSLCGEEAFGTSGDHVREKDGLWAVLAWLSILAYRNEKPDNPFVPVEQIVREHWAKFGRTFSRRHDYEYVSTDAGSAVMEHLRSLIGRPKERPKDIVQMDEFHYTDPISGDVSIRQGIRVCLEDGSRIVYRLSGTGSVGSTVRIYLERYEANPLYHSLSNEEALDQLISTAIDLAKIGELTGRDQPTVVT